MSTNRTHGSRRVARLPLLLPIFLVLLTVAACGRNRAPEPMVTPTPIAVLAIPESEVAAAEIPTLAPTAAPTVAPPTPTQVPTEAATEAATEVPAQAATEVPTEVEPEAATEVPTEAPAASAAEGAVSPLATPESALAESAPLTATTEAVAAESAATDATSTPQPEPEESATAEPVAEATTVRLIGGTPTPEFAPAVATTTAPLTETMELTTTEPLTVSEGEAEPEASATETAVLTPAEEIAALTEVTSTGSLTATEALSATEAVTETEAVTGTEAVTETEAVTGTEELTATESLIDSVALTETETSTPTEDVASLLGGAVIHLPGVAAAAPITLSAGLFESETITAAETLTDDAAAAPAAVQRARLLPFVAEGNLNEDDATEAAAVVQVTRASRFDLYLVAFAQSGGEPAQQAAVLLGSGLALNNLAIEDGVILVSVELPGPNNAVCCPVAAEERTYALRSGRLVLQSTESLTLPETPALRRPVTPSRIRLPAAASGKDASATRSDGLGAGEAHVYSVAGEAGVTLTVTVTSAEQSLILVVAGTDESIVLASAGEQLSAWSGVLPTTQEYLISVVSLGEATSYSLTVEMAQAESDASQE